jgi:hypothetical protein
MFGVTNKSRNFAEYCGCNSSHEVFGNIINIETNLIFIKQTTMLKVDIAFKTRHKENTTEPSYVLDYISRVVHVQYLC